MCIMTRPSAAALFNADVIKVLEHELTHEKLIYERAKERHIQMLSVLNLTIESAAAKWIDSCI